MIIGRVTGAVYSTINHKFYNRKKLLLIEKINPDKTPDGNYIIAVDSVGAGTGEIVLIIDEGNSARQITDDSSAPIRSIIVGIIDEIQNGSS